VRNPLPRRPDVAPRPDVPVPPEPARSRRRAWPAVVLVLGLILVSVPPAVVLSRDDRAAPSSPPVPSRSSRSPSREPDTRANEVDPETAFRFLRRRPDGEPVRWDPCVPLHFEVNLDGAPPRASRVIGQAVARVGAATGIRFVDDGTTRRTAAFTGSRDLADHEDGRIIDYPLLISWVPPRVFGAYGNPNRYAAVGIPVRGHGDDEWWYVSGIIVINRGSPAPASFSYRGAMGPLLLHEWGHVVGLAHVRDGDQIMYSRDLVGADRDPSLSLTDYAKGDLAGLAELGREAGCGPG
jgi:hypothetical protein